MEKDRAREQPSAAPSCCAPTCCTPEADAATQAKEDIREVVKEKYGQAVRAVLKGAKPS